MADVDYYCGEIRMFAGPFAPLGWKFCDGRELLITEYQQLYARVGNAYGTAFKGYFRLPDLQGRVPVHSGSGPGLTPRQRGQSFGAETVTLTTDDIQKHQHSIYSTNICDSDNPKDHYLAEHPTESKSFRMYGFSNLTTHMAEATIGKMDGCLSKAHDNMMPSLAINFIIATSGI